MYLQGCFLEITVRIVSTLKLHRDDIKSMERKRKVVPGAMTRMTGRGQRSLLASVPQVTKDLHRSRPGELLGRLQEHDPSWTLHRCLDRSSPQMAMSMDERSVFVHGRRGWKEMHALTRMVVANLSEALLGLEMFNSLLICLRPFARAPIDCEIAWTDTKG